MSVYVLRLVSDKYYVGYTEREDVSERIWEHVWKMDSGAEWTKLYPVREVVDIYENATLATEKQVTIECMRKYGWENVRGSIYCAVNMKEPPFELLNDEHSKQLIPLRHLKEKHQQGMILQNCYNCNQPGHLASQCTMLFCRLCSAKGHIAKDCPEKKTGQIKCFQCGQKGHLKSECTVKVARCYSCQQPGHYSNQCPVKKEKVHLSKTYGACFKCNQTGHWAKDCPGGGGGAGGGGLRLNNNNNKKTGACFKCKQPGHWTRNCPN